MKPWVAILLAVVAPTGIDARSLDAVESAIVGGASASQVLGRWCVAHGLPALTARREPGAAKAPDRTVLGVLAVARPADLRYRRVSLGCGGVVLSRADNWYAPDRLTADMNHRLEATDAPFGQVVGGLNFHRTTLKAVERQHGLEVRAVLAKADGTPFSYVVEDYVRRP